MIRGAVYLLMVWLMAGPPALCRAGVLDECCDQRSADWPAATVESGCCADGDGGCGADQRAPEPIPRKCGTCAGVCTSLVKPSEDSNTVSLAEAAFIPVHIDPEPLIAEHTSRIFLRSCRQPALPYPHSDVPLLI